MTLTTAATTSGIMHRCTGCPSMATMTMKVMVTTMDYGDDDWWSSLRLPTHVEGDHRHVVDIG